MNSFIGWIGGKRLLRKAIIDRFPQDEISRYIEVFGGAGWVLFAKEKQSGQLEVFNDINSDLVNLFRCVKYHGEELQRELEWLLSSREQFSDYLEQINTRGLTDIQRAARYFYLIKISFGNNGRTFATNSKSLDNTIDYLPKVRERLKGVVIENKDFSDLVRVYDRASALFYLDPPYVGTEKHYSHPFTKEDHHRLRESLDNLQGRFILSYNDDDFVRDLYSGYRIEPVSRNETLSHTGNNKAQFAELIIRNF